MKNIMDNKVPKSASNVGVEVFASIDLEKVVFPEDINEIGVGAFVNAKPEQIVESQKRLYSKVKKIVNSIRSIEKLANKEALIEKLFSDDNAGKILKYNEEEIEQLRKNIVSAMDTNGYVLGVDVPRVGTVAVDIPTDVEKIGVPLDNIDLSQIKIPANVRVIEEDVESHSRRR